VLLHPTALPGTPACGSFGEAAAAWIRLLAAEGVGVWQLLPLAPTDGGGSPYSSPSGFALNPWLLDGQRLVEDGLLEPVDLEDLPAGSSAGLDLVAAAERSELLARRLLERWPDQGEDQRRAFGAWFRKEQFWLRDHCRFMVLRRLNSQAPWWQWPQPLARRQARALAELDRNQEDALLQEALVQWQLQVQWLRLLDLARSLGVEIMGDLPFYVAHDSADVWSHRRLFSLDSRGSLRSQSGVPPDYFSTTGQLWGTPVYSWLWHRLGGFGWWLQRLERQLELFDCLRLDHFRALDASWCVPGGDATAEHGTWRSSPGRALLKGLLRRVRKAGGGTVLPLVAEDLGVITPGVEALRDDFQLPGMKILQFAFDGDPGNAYLPENYAGTNWVVYTGTHDNATCIGWWASLGDEERRRVEACLGEAVHAPGWQLLRLALESPADLAVVPLQDLLHLDDAARFNTPGTTQGNWQWRLQAPIASLQGPLLGLGQMARHYDRGCR
jgi:4-alpha-glucanotransferase